MDGFYTHKIRCGNCGKMRKVCGSIGVHKSAEDFAEYIRKNGVSPCPCREAKR